MWPKIGPLETYMLFYVGAMLAHLPLALYYCRRYGLSRRTGVGFSFCFFLGMALGARILYDLLHFPFEWRRYLSLAYLVSTGLWGGPLAYLALAVGGVLLFGRRRRAQLDVVVLSLPVPMILAKVACFFNGCCYGAESDLPWAIAFPEGADAPAGVLRHPTQLYEIAALAAALLVLRAVDRDRWRGLLLFWFVLVYGVGRPLTEGFRAAEKYVPRLGPFTDSQIACIAGAILSAVVIVTVGLHSRKAQVPDLGSMLAVG